MSPDAIGARGDVVPEGVTMRAAVMTDYKTDLEVRDVPAPEPKPGEVLVRVAGAGLCHSDLHLIEGEIPIIPGFPWILGHEVTGWVEVPDPQAPDFERGHPVAIFGGWGCGHCSTCLAGEEQLCDTTRWVGIGRPGGFAEFVVVPSRHLVSLGDLDPAGSAPLTDAALTPYRAVRKTLPRLVPGTTAVVIGGGGLGQFGVEMLRELSPARIVVVEPSPTHAEVVSQLGAAEVHHPDDDALTGLEGKAAAVIDFVGSDQTLALAARLAAPRGRVVMVGIAGGTLPMTFFSPRTEVEVSTSYWGNRNELEQVIALAAEGRITPRVHEVDLAAVNSAIADLRSGSVEGRIVLVP